MRTAIDLAEIGKRRTYRKFVMWIAYPHHLKPLFCRLSCVAEFAYAAYDAGWRRSSTSTIDEGDRRT